VGVEPIERMMEECATRGVPFTWVVKAAFLDDPKVAARVERARSRGYRVEIDPTQARDLVLRRDRGVGGLKEWLSKETTRS
jgi:hypothetical protein